MAPHDGTFHDTSSSEIDWSQDRRVAALLDTVSNDPFGFLGMHDGPDGPELRCFIPWAKSVSVIDAGSGDVTTELPRVHDAGFFAGPAGKPQRFAYRLRIGTEDGVVDMADAYSFGPVLSDYDIYLLAEGNHNRAYEKLGAHPMTMDGVPGVGFAVWAPSARSASLVGAFGDWDGRRFPMRNHPSCGIWDIFIPHLEPGQPYKFELHGADGHRLPLKSDPYADQAELRPQNASVVAKPSAHHWQDGDWMGHRAGVNDRAAPISIYEVHLGSWKRGPDNRYLTYRELADELVPYVKEMGFTHIEVLPPSEHPFDGSWGYQPIGLFAPTSRFGTPDDFRHFVDACHQAGIALWIDWVPGHFPTDEHGLARFDGTHLYEHADPRQGFHKDWNTLIFNYGRKEVRNYLIANALSWLDRFHIDGLRVDAVASMLYLDYSRNEGEWIPNAFGGRENLEAIDFLRKMNELVYQEAPGAVTAAEESTSWPMVSQPTHVGGLGFGFKWNMGWMNDTLRYMRNEPIHRRYHHNDLTFGLLYAFSENFILPLSHDEVVHGKGSIIGRMPGDDWQRHANLRAYYGFMWGHPGKKLLFMGCEFGQDKEWNFDASLDWHTLDNPMKRGVQSLVRDLNNLYKSEPALHRLDCNGAGFAWVDASDSDQSVLSFLRYAPDKKGTVLVVCNFTPVPRHDYRIGVPHAGFWAERINTDAKEYGGSGVGNDGGLSAEPIAWHGHEQSLHMTLPPLSTVIFRHQDG